MCVRQVRCSRGAIVFMIMFITTTIAAIITTSTSTLQVRWQCHC